MAVDVSQEIQWSVAMCVRAREQMLLPWIKLESQETRTGQRHQDWKEGTRVGAWHGWSQYSRGQEAKEEECWLVVVGS